MSKLITITVLLALCLTGLFHRTEAQVLGELEGLDEIVSRTGVIKLIGSDIDGLITVTFKNGDTISFKAESASENEMNRLQRAWDTGATVTIHVIYGELEI